MPNLYVGSPVVLSASPGLLSMPAIRGIVYNATTASATIQIIREAPGNVPLQPVFTFVGPISAGAGKFITPVPVTPGSHFRVLFAASVAGSRVYVW